MRSIAGAWEARALGRLRARRIAAAQWFALKPVGPDLSHSEALRSRSAFTITETELTLIAALAIIGLRSRPKKG